MFLTPLCYAITHLTKKHARKVYMTHHKRISTKIKQFFPRYTKKSWSPKEKVWFCPFFWLTVRQSKNSDTIGWKKNWTNIPFILCFDEKLTLKKYFLVRNTIYVCFFIRITFCNLFHDLIEIIRQLSNTLISNENWKLKKNVYAKMFQISNVTSKNNSTHFRWSLYTNLRTHCVEIVTIKKDKVGTFMIMISPWQKRVRKVKF